MNDSYFVHVFGAFIIAALGLSLVSVPFVALALSRVRQADSGAASSVVNVTPLVGGSVGIAALGTVAWTTAAHQIHLTGPAGPRRPSATRWLPGSTAPSWSPPGSHWRS